MSATIISIGDELVSGLTINTNAAWLGMQLARVGIPVRAHLTAGDSVSAVSRMICQAIGESSLVLVSGGLGPTEDDITRAALADALGEKLVEDAAALASVEAFFSQLNRPMAPGNKIQALRPSSASSIANSCGTAPGIFARRGQTDIFVMPGVPREMKAMFEQSFLPMLMEKAGPDGRITEIAKFNTFGIGESVLGQKVADLMQRSTNPAVGTTVHDGIVSVRVYATGKRGEVQAMIAEKTRQIQERLGPLIFSHGDEPLEAAVATLLTAKKQMVATAESCTGGLLAELLTNIPGSSRYFSRGWITYCNQAKAQDLQIPVDLLVQHGAVSESVAAAMATNARRVADVNWGIGITGIAGPDGGTAAHPVGLVFVGLAGVHGVSVRRCQFPGDRAGIRLRAAHMALTLLRLKLMGLEPESVLAP